MDVRAILRKLSARDHQAIRRRKGYATKDVVMTTGELRHIRAHRLRELAVGQRAQPAQVQGRTSGVVRCRASRVSFARLHSWGAWPLVGEFLDREHLPGDFSYLMAYPLGLSSDEDGWTTPTDTAPTETRALMETMLAAIG